MDMSAVVGFWAVSVVLVLTPGADWAYSIAAGLRHRSVLPAVGGMVSGHLVAALVVAAGLGALAHRFPIVVTVTTVVGALYLIWLGANAVARPVGLDQGNDGGDGWLRQAATGFGVSGLNPKVLLLFLALLPQFTRPGTEWPLGAQLLLLGVVHVVNCALVYPAVGLTARSLLRSRPSAARIVGRVSGLVMGGLGIVLLLERLPSAGQ